MVFKPSWKNVCNAELPALSCLTLSSRRWAPRQACDRQSSPALWRGNYNPQITCLLGKDMLDRCRCLWSYSALESRRKMFRRDWMLSRYLCISSGIHVAKEKSFGISCCSDCKKQRSPPDLVQVSRYLAWFFCFHLLLTGILKNKHITKEHNTLKAIAKCMKKINLEINREVLGIYHIFI